MYNILYIFKKSIKTSIEYTDLLCKERLLATISKI